MQLSLRLNAKLASWLASWLKHVLSNERNPSGGAGGGGSMCPNCSSNWLVRLERACPPVPSALHACKWRVVLINDAGAPLCPPDNVCLMCLSSDASRPPPPPPPPVFRVPLCHACLLRVVVAATRVPACLLGLSALFQPTSLPSHRGHVALFSFIIRVTAGGGNYPQLPTPRFPCSRSDGRWEKRGNPSVFQGSSFLSPPNDQKRQI